MFTASFYFHREFIILYYNYTSFFSIQMSRRTRMNSRKSQNHFGFGTNHHTQYSSSTSYFPKCYSALGKQIKFPSTAVSFLNKGKLTFYGEFQEFEKKIVQLTQIDFLQIHTVNIGIKGKIYQQMSKLNNCVFALSMVLCFISEVFDTSLYRDQFYTKYSFEMQKYKKIMNTLKLMPRLQTAMLTFQDNDLTKEKIQYLDEQFSNLHLKSVTLRNLSYFIQPEQKILLKHDKVLGFDLIEKTQTQFIFVWQHVNVHYNSDEMEEQAKSITFGLDDEI